MLKIGFTTIALLLWLASGCSSETDKKWVWQGNSRANKLQDEGNRKASPRYEIFEPEGGDYDYDREPIRPGRPPGPLGPLGYPNRPGPGGPGGPGGFGGDFDRPQRPYYPQPNIGLGGGLGGGGGNFPGRPPVKQFDTCSCTEKFNCQSPGISYGHCDVGKSYCCFNKHGGAEFGPAPSRPIQSPANGILVGPSNGGDIGYGTRPDYGGHLGDFERPRPGGPGGFYDRDRPSYGRPGYGPRPGYGGHGGRPQGVLVGPGGPTGIIGRPGLSVRPIHSPENGILVGPGGPYDRPPGSYGGGPYNNNNRPFYGRSATPGSDILSDSADAKSEKKTNS